jgi:hypothetical protein
VTKSGATSVTLDVRVSVINYGNDIARDVNVDLFDTENYTIVSGTLPAGCTYNSGKTTCQYGTVIPGQYKEFIIQFKIVEAETNDITAIIDQINSLFTGTFVDDHFDVNDPVPLKLNAYDFKIVSLSYEQIDNEKITINASAVNRGIDGANVKFRIYPVIDGVIQDNIAESNINNMSNTQVASINTEYYFRGLSGELKLVAFIDPDDEYKELYENNNSAELKFTLTSLDELNNKNSLSAFPNPSGDEVNFEYNLSKAPKNINIQFFTMSGTEVDRIESVPAVNGENKISHNIGKLAPGQYIYKVSIDYGTEVVRYNGVLVKQ